MTCSNIHLAGARSYTKGGAIVEYEVAQSLEARYSRHEARLAPSEKLRVSMVKRYAYQIQRIKFRS